MTVSQNECAFCRQEAKYQCDYVGADGACHNEVCADHAVPEFLDTPIERWTLCEAHKHDQKQS